jgi:hypothetical protein
MSIRLIDNQRFADVKLSDRHSAGNSIATEFKGVLIRYFEECINGNI